MLIVQDQIWGRVTQNRSQGKATWYFCDEFHLLSARGTDGSFFLRDLEAVQKMGRHPDRGDPER